jgi:hypothetical protein
MFDKIKKWFAPTEVKPEPVAAVKKAPKKKELTPKEQANAIGEPYVNIISVELDPADINNGSFELDWNDKFVANLIKQGYKIRPDDTDAQIVDRWFQTVCRNIALEVYEQEIADPDKRESEMRIIQQRDLGGGFTEVS